MYTKSLTPTHNESRKPAKAESLQLLDRDFDAMTEEEQRGIYAAFCLRAESLKPMMLK